MQSFNLEHFQVLEDTPQQNIEEQYQCKLVYKDIPKYFNLSDNLILWLLIKINLNEAFISAKIFFFTKVVVEMRWWDTFGHLVKFFPVLKLRKEITPRQNSLCIKDVNLLFGGGQYKKLFFDWFFFVNRMDKNLSRYLFCPH